MSDRGMGYEAQGLLTTSVSHLLRSISLRNQEMVSDLACGSGMSDGCTLVMSSRTFRKHDIARLEALKAWRYK